MATKRSEPRSTRRLATRVRALCAFTAAMAVRDARRARRALLAAQRNGTIRLAAEEAALMLMLYAGYPSALESLRVLNDVWPGRASRSREGTTTRWRTQGSALCKRVYGSAYDKLIPMVQRLHPDLAVWMEEHGYGRVLSRPGLTPRERELITIATLAALGWERQLVSHLLGARRVGAGAEEVRNAFRTGLAVSDEVGRAASRRAWDQVGLLPTSRPAA